LFSFGQAETENTNYKELATMEQELAAIGDSMIDGSHSMVRIKALSQFIPTLVKALKIKGSYDYPFDSLRFILKLKPSDNRFRLYNWNLKFDDGTFRFYGVLQFPGDTLKILPLYDRTNDFMFGLEDTILYHENWNGAQYYQIFSKDVKREGTFYFLIGWDGFKKHSNKKLVEVLKIIDTDSIQFGAPLFEHNGRLKTRVVFEYKPDADMFLEYIKEKDLIVFDHMVPPNKQAEGKFFTYIPDGTYDYFEWNKKKRIWQFGELLFGEEGNSPADDGKATAKPGGSDLIKN